MKYIHKECGGEIKSPLQKTATCLSCGKSTDNWKLSDDGRYRIHFQTKKEIALGKQEEKTIKRAKKAGAGRQPLNSVIRQANTPLPGPSGPWLA